MSRINDYPTASSIASDDYFIMDGDTNGTRKLTIDTISEDVAESDSISSVIQSNISSTVDFYDLVNDYPMMHRNVYRGQSLGTSVTSDQLSTISSGDFDDIFIGDYWTISSIKWVVADLDYWRYCGDTSFTSHHAVIIPATNLYSTQMNSSNTTEGAYLGSEMYTANLEDAKTTIDTCFGDNVLSHREYFTNTVTNYYASAGEWADSTVDLMNEAMAYGNRFYGVCNDTSSTIPNNYTIDKSQLSLFRLCPYYINTNGSGSRISWWLRDVASATYFACVGTGGHAGCGGASGSGGVRPAFAIG